MTERAPESYRAQFDHEPRDPFVEEARQNALIGLGLFALFLLLFAGTFVVALLYLQFD